MATTISTQDLIDVKRDIDDIGKAVNEKVVVSPRYGEDFKSLPMIADEAQATIGEWQDAINTIVVNDGVPALAVSDASGKTQQEVNDSILDPVLKVPSAPMIRTYDEWNQKDWNDGVIDVRKFIKKDMSNVTTGLQAAIEEAYGQKLYIPIPLQVLDTIYIERALILEGNKNTNYNSEYSLDFSMLGAGKDALSIGQTTITAGLTLKDLYIQGVRNGGTGILLGKSLEYYSADFKVENVTLNGFDQGAKFSFVWDGFLNNFRVQNCTNGINHENQVNALLYSQCRVVSIGNFALQFTNAEGVQFDACDISNLKRLAGSPISVFQSTLTFNTPYFEYIDGPSLMSVGSVGETIGSSVVINNPQKLGKNIVVGNPLDYVEINGQDKDKVHVVGATLTTNINAKVSQREIKKAKNVIYHWNPKQLPSFPAYGGVAPTVLDYRNYLQLTSASATAGWAITTSLVVGKTYTLRYCIRKTATTDTLGLRHPATFVPLVSDDVALDPTIRTTSFVAESTNLNMTWSGAIELFGLEIIEGNLSEFDQDPFHQSDFDRIVSVDRVFQPTTTGNWKAGDTVNKAPLNANPITQWVYHGAVWRAATWATLNLPTVSLPTLTSNDIGVEVYDTTTSTFKRWNGAAWV